MIFKVKVFLSWAGKRSRSHIVAEALHNWLPKVIHFADPFLSSDDILVGERWNGVLDRELDASGFGILCVSKRALTSPWVLFEAGVLAGGYHNAKRVCPYLIDIDLEHLHPPLNQFNAASADEIGTYRMLKSLNSTPQGPLLSDEVLRSSFKVWWEELNAALTEARKKEE